MDLETENRIATILMKEAAEMRRQADKEGVHAYLRQPNTRFRPNSRFLNATVLGVQQANRAVDVNEMWNIRQKERELDERLKARDKDRDRRRSGWRHGDTSDSQRSTSKRHDFAERSDSDSGRGEGGCSSSKRTSQECYSREDEGFEDDDIDEFLRSRAKRGRGAVGMRMDEPGPYLHTSLDTTEYRSTDNEKWGRKVILGPEKPWSLIYSEDDGDDPLKDKRKKADQVSSSKRHSKKSKSKEKSKDKKKKKKRKDERRSKRRREWRTLTSSSTQ